MMDIHIKTFGKMLIVAMGMWMIVAGPAWAAQRHAGAGNHSARNRNAGASSRAGHSRAQADRSRPPHARSATRQRQSAPPRKRSSASSTKSQPNRHKSYSGANRNRSTADDRRKAPASTRKQPRMSDARQHLGGTERGKISSPKHAPRRISPQTPRKKAGPNSNQQRFRPHHQATTQRKTGPQFGKGPKKKQHANRQSSPKHGGRSNIGKKPIPKTHAGKGVPKHGKHNRSKIGDVHKRLVPQKHANSRAVPRSGRNTSMTRHHNRLKKGELARLTAGKTARSLRLADQYRMVRHGDVARRMGFYNHGPRPNFHRGHVSPKYTHHCFKHRYWGPSLFAGVHWYPRWSPWVQWSWGYVCNPYWDPRPIYCRPVVYAPAPAWVYWETPIWIPLPVVACGTWVDLPPVRISDPRSDLQLVAVRFVDPGHMDKKLGPRYRVWFRNNGNRPISRPFDVMLFAGNEERLAADVPQAGVRVTAIEAGEVQSVDIRLPIEVYATGRDAQGNPTPFSVLQVLVDAAEEIAETTKANNGASLPPADILPIDPAAFELEPIVAKSGGEVLLAGEGFGPQPGRVLLIVGREEIDAEILGWYDLGVRFTMPKLMPARMAEAEVIVVRGDGAAANPLKITVLPN